MESGVHESNDAGAIAISNAIFGLCGEEGGFDRVLRMEVPEAGRASEAFDMDSPHRDDMLKAIPPEQVYDALGGDAVVVEPVLSGRRRLIVTYGRAADRRRILQELASHAGTELAKRAEQCAHVKLYSLNVACLKCGLCDSEEDVVFDLLGQQIVDAAGITRESISSILKPLNAEAVSNIAALLTSRHTHPSERSGFFILHMEAGHANDIGALTAVSVPSAERMNEEITDNRRDRSHGLAEHAASLRRLGGLVDAFSQRVSNAGTSSGTFSSLLLLMPRRCPALSHYAMVVRQCFQLRNEHDRTVQGEDLDEESHRHPSISSRCFTERNCVLASPPGSDQLSWDTDGSITPSAVSSPEMRPSVPSIVVDDMPDGHISSARQGTSGCSLRPDQTGIPGELIQAVGTSVSAVAPGNSLVANPGATSSRAGCVHGEFAESPRQFLHLLAGEEQMLAFHPEDMLRNMQEEGRSSEQQVQELLQVVLKLQQRHREVVAISRRFIQSLLSTRDTSADGSLGAQSVGNSSGSVSTGAGAATADRLRWSQRVPATAASLWNEAPVVANSSPRLMARAGLQARQPPPIDGGRHCVLGSPRWVSSSGEPKRSPVRQPSGMLLHERGMDNFASNEPPPSPLTRSRSATFPSCSVLGLVPQVPGKAMTIHGDVAVSPQVPPRDISTARSRSVMQASMPASLSVVPHLQSQLQRGLTPQACGSLIPSTTVPGLPPPVQLSTGTGAQIDAQSVLPSPRKQQRLCDDGVRSPLPAPPGHVLTYPKAIDRTPHSARSSFVVAGLSYAPPAENVRWDHASPCRVRYMASSTSANATSPTRQLLGPPPKTTPPGGGAGPRPSDGPHVSASYSRTLRVSISSKSAK